MIVVVPLGREGRVRRRRGGGEVLQEADGADVDAYEYVGGLRRQVSAMRGCTFIAYLSTQWSYSCETASSRSLPSTCQSNMPLALR